MDPSKIRDFVEHFYEGSGTLQNFLGSFDSLKIHMVSGPQTLNKKHVLTWMKTLEHHSLDFYYEIYQYMYSAKIFPFL